MPHVIVYKLLQNPVTYLVRHFFGPDLEGPRLGVSLQSIGEYQRFLLPQIVVKKRGYVAKMWCNFTGIEALDTSRKWNDNFLTVRCKIYRLSSWSSSFFFLQTQIGCSLISEKVSCTGRTILRCYLIFWTVKRNWKRTMLTIWRDTLNSRLSWETSCR